MAASLGATAAARQREAPGCRENLAGKVLTEAQVEEALRMVEAERPDLVLVDHPA
jgi:CheY-like chemotaxis protein